MILVTGGAGFIGSALVRELNKIGREDIVIVDRLRSTHKWLNLRQSMFDEYVHADDFFGPGMEFLHNKISFIFHMGACSSTLEQDVDFLIQNNLNYSKKLWNMSIEQDVPLIYASSAATYGAGELGHDDDHKSIAHLRPLNAYGWSKQLFDQWALKQIKMPEKWFGLKFFNVFGPNEYHKEDMRSLVHKGFEQINKSGEMKLFKSHKDGFKDGGQLRDFIYVKDICRAIICLMDEKCQAENGIYNLGTGKERSFLDLAKATFKAMNRDENIKFIDMPSSLRKQYQYLTKANMDKFHRNIQGFEFTPLEEAIHDYVTDHLLLSNPYY